MSRFKLTLEYDGGAFVGWQRQDNGFTVQQALEEAVQRLTGQASLVQGAGRTDAGVHALGQVAHVDIDKPFTPEKLRAALNAHLRPHPVAVLAVAAVPEDFHARFDATERAYLYRILNRPPPPVLERGRVWWVSRPLDAEAMQEAAQYLVGNHDFTSFRALMCQAKSPVKTLDRLSVRRVGEEIHIDVLARSFLHNQVRIMVGSLSLVGSGKWRPQDMATALEARDRCAAGPTARPEGLYLSRVGYEGG